MKQKKMIFVTGGVLSSLGKGISAASLGMLMEQRGISVTMIKMDPYLNLDPGTMNPSQHGEVFVLDDGSETDLDLGHYSRFVKNACFTKKNSFTTGKIYDLVLRKERAGEYLGETIQVIPHITDEIKKHIREAASDADLAIIEVGGTVGDIESLPFLEAIRQMRVEEGEGNVLFIHLTLVPYVATAGELKTKPTQHSVKELRGIGIQPDILLCRCDRTLPKEAREKIGLFCNVSGSQVFTAMDVSSIYEVPLAFHEEGLDEKVSEKLGIWSGTPDLSEWKQMVMKLRSPRNKVSIGIIGKYTDWRDSYKSLSEALVHGGVCHDASVQVEYVDAERLDVDSVAEFLKSVQGILVPGGFGERGAEGKIVAIEYARNHKIPFFGICLGMQLAVVEYARHLCGMPQANSAEFQPQGSANVIDWMPSQKGLDRKGGTMRLGAYTCELVQEIGGVPTRAYQDYGRTQVVERHRHRFEVSSRFLGALEAEGLVVSGRCVENGLVEMVELREHPWFLGCQFHPEFLSRPLEPHPLFASFIGAALEHS